MWNAWTAPPGALPHDYDPWSCEAHCVRCRELAQDCHCEDEQMIDPQLLERGRRLLAKHFLSFEDIANMREVLQRVIDAATLDVSMNEDTDDIDDRTR